MSGTPDLSGLPETPGVSRKKIIALDNAVGEWREAVEKRMKLSEVEVEKREHVLDIMIQKNVTTYRYMDNDVEKILVIVPGKDKPKLKLPEKDGDDEGDGEAAE